MVFRKVGFILYLEMGASEKKVDTDSGTDDI